VDKPIFYFSRWTCLKALATDYAWTVALMLIVVTVVCGCATQQMTASGTQNGNVVTSPANGKGEIAQPTQTPKDVKKVIPPQSIAMWVPKGSGTFIIDTQRLFHGIGGSTSSNNPILLRASADNRSREELTALLSRFITYVTDTYWNQDGGRTSSDVANLQVLQNTFLAVARDSLTRSRIAGHWQDPKSGEFYALCQLTLADLMAAVGKDTRLDKRSRDYFLQQGQRLYDQFSRESGVEAS